MKKEKTIDSQNAKKTFTFLKKCFLLFLLTLVFQGTVFGQEGTGRDLTLKKRISFDLKDRSLTTALKKIEELSGAKIEYKNGETSPYKVTVNIKEKTAAEALTILLKDTPLVFYISSETIVIKRQEETPAAGGRKLRGKIIDRDGLPLIGATVDLWYNRDGEKELINAKNPQVTDLDGYFNYAIPGNVKNAVFRSSYIGMNAAEVAYRGEEDFVMVMDESKTHELKGVVVEAGIIQRDRMGFTGSYNTVSQEQLKSIGNVNVLQSLKTLDPSFVISDNMLAGSNPNVLAEINVRGGSGVDFSSTQDQAKVSSNAPLFILDGFEATQQEISDLDVNRVASFTILKDAGSTAIYGSKGANGVIVVETVRPKGGEIRVKYNNITKLSFADLSEYNMMNAAEKLEFERQSLRWGVIDGENNVTSQVEYYKRKAAIESGVDTYWLKEPIRTGITHDHSVSVAGGEKSVLFDVGANYRKVEGVMKDSDRESFSGDFKLIYRAQKGLNISNNARFYGANAHTGSWGSFSDFVRASPYYTKRDALGRVTKILDSNFLTIKPDAQKNESMQEVAYNPLYNALLDSRNDDKTYVFSNKTYIDWYVKDNLKLAASLLLERSNRRTEIFTDPRNTRYINDDYTKKGEYESIDMNSWTVSGNTTADYKLSLDKIHNFTLIGRFSLLQKTSKSEGTIAVGFPESTAGLPSSAYSYKEGTRPSYREDVRREVSSVFVFNYNYKYRYLLDASYNMDGANTFGRNKKFENFWSVGIGWNLDQEDFAKGWDWLSNLKISGSTGENANQDVDALTHSVYSYYTGNTQFGTGAYMSEFGNPNLRWQKVKKNSVSLDGEFLNNRLRVRFDLYSNKTNPLISELIQKPSSGVASYPINLGYKKGKGVEFIVEYSPIYNKDENIFLNVRLMGAFEKQNYGGFGNALEDLNENLTGGFTPTEKLKSLERFEDGRSPYDIWAVQSLGIDPATGKEVFQTKEGKQTFDYDVNDRVVVGNSKPDVEGTFGFYFTYKKLQTNLFFRYRLGGEMLNYALYNKVENISSAQVVYNQDKRALYGRWQNPGDIAEFKSIALLKNAYSDVSSRFVQKNNQLIGESINIMWDFSGDKWLESVKIKNLRAGISMTDIFRINTIKVERSIDYPFERAVSFNLSATF